MLIDTSTDCWDGSLSKLEDTVDKIRKTADECLNDLIECGSPQPWYAPINETPPGVKRDRAIATIGICIARIEREIKHAKSLMCKACLSQIYDYDD